MDRARRKALLQAYKHELPPMGIFAVRHVPSGRVLIDLSLNLTGAINRHRVELRLGTHRHRALMEDWRRDGEAAFVFEVLERIAPRSEPDFDYRVALVACLEAWRLRVPLGSVHSYL